MKNCIVAFANERGNYLQGLTRLSETLVQQFDGDFIPSVGESTIGAPDHLSNPYAFKIYAFEKALNLGYKKILYLDCSVWATRPVWPIFEFISLDGFLMQEAGHYLKDWINDNALNYFGVKREELGNTIMYGNAGMLGLNFDHPAAVEFFKRWKDAMLAGAFIGSWDNHRHDMSCGSLIAWQLGMDKKYVKGDQILEYAGWNDPVKNDSIIFKAAGL